jgi:hypothetical protein
MSQDELLDDVKWEDDDGGDGDGDGGDAPEGQKAILAKLTEIEQRNESLAKIAADPDVRRILEARQKGEQVKVTVGEDKPPEPEPGWPDDEDLDMLSNTQLADKVLKRAGEDVGRRLDKVMSTLQQVTQFVRTNEGEAVKRQVDEARAKYRDFDKFKQPILELNGKFPGLSVEELYFLAKKRAGGLEAPSGPTASEKPTTSPTKPSKRKEQVAAGRAGFGDLLDQAMDDFDLSEF